MSQIRPRVLIVEDALIAQKVAVMTMGSLNCDTDTASTGAKALEQFGQHHYDLILMDLGLPDMTGLAVTQTIRHLEANAKKRTVIVALTAHSDSETRKHARKVGMDDLVEKPLTVEIAQEILNKYVLPSSSAIFHGQKHY